jgi:O-antigen/teichoic acid export membrane protein
LSNIKKLFGQAAIYGASSIFGRAINFLLVPLYTAVFEPEAYGIVTELYAYVAFLMIVYLFGLETAFFRFSSKYENKKSIYRISVTLTFVLSILFSGFLLFFSDSLAATLEYPGQGVYIRWLAYILALDTLVSIPFAQLRQEGRAIKFASFKILNILLNVGFNLFFLIGCPWLLTEYPDIQLQWIYTPEIGVGYVFLSNLLASVATFLFFTKSWIRFRFGWNYELIKSILAYAAPLVIIGFAGVINEMLSRAILKYRLPEGYYPGLTNLAVLGIFGACYKLSMLMNLAVQAFRYAYEPFFFSKSSDKDSPETFASVMDAFILFGCLAVMGLSLVLPEVAPLVLRRTDYLSALHIVPALLLGGLFLGIYYNLSVWYKLTDRTHYGAIVSVTGAVVTILLNWFLIPVLGYEGSALATVLTYLSMVLMSFLWGRKFYPVPYKIGKAVWYLFYSLSFLIALHFVGFTGLLKYVVFVPALVIFLIVPRLFKDKNSKA